MKDSAPDVMPLPVNRLWKRYWQQHPYE